MVVEVDATTLAAVSAIAFGVTKFAIYSKMQFITGASTMPYFLVFIVSIVMIASIIGGIPANFKVAELDTVDGKNIFYLPKGTDYTAIMPVTKVCVVLLTTSISLSSSLQMSKTTGDGSQEESRQS